MEQKNLPIGQGCILIAEPFLSDTYFKRAVILVTEFNEEGTAGLILNKPIDLDLNVVLPGFPLYKEAVYMGGPVATNQLFYIHTLGNKISGSTKIVEGLYWNGDFDIVKEMFQQQQVKPDQLRFYAGYAGWDAGQLQKEYKEKSWIITKPRKEDVFNNNPGKLWHDTLRSMGKEYAIMANFPEDPQLN